MAISNETKKQIQALRKEGMSLEGIAHVTAAPYATVYGLTAAVEHGHQGTTGYQNAVAEERINPETGRPFQSRRAYDAHREHKRAQNPVNVFISSALRSAFESSDYNKRSLAHKLNISEKTVRYYLEGKTLPPPEVLQRLCDLLNIQNKSRLEEVLKNKKRK